MCKAINGVVTHQQTNMHNYMKPLLERIEKGQIDPWAVAAA
jgi:hypothetical protein